MGIRNADFWIKEYVDDFGNKYPNYKFKISGVAPRFNDVKGAALYQERVQGVACGDTRLFKHRRLRVKFYNGATIEFPVARPDLIDDMVKILKPSLLNNAIPGAGGDEAACIDLIGEKWNFVPPGLIGASQSDFQTTPITNGDPEAGDKKTTYVYKYVSEVPTVGEITTSFPIHDDSETLRNCQLEGMTDYELKDTSIVPCSAKTLGVKPRHFLIKSALTFDSNGLFIGGQQDKAVIRMAPVSGDSGLLFSDKAKAVGKKLADCAYCLGWNGESVKNVHLLLSGTEII
jgi:hypothetical protein